MHSCEPDCWRPAGHPGPHQYDPDYPKPERLAQLDDEARRLEAVVAAAQAVLAASSKYTFGPTMDDALARLDGALDAVANGDRCVECGERWPCDATVRQTKDRIPHRKAGGPVCACGHALNSHRQDPVDPWVSERCVTCGCASFNNRDDAKMQGDDG